MSRLLFFLLLIANLAFGAHLWLTAPPAEPDFSKRERNREEALIAGVEGAMVHLKRLAPPLYRYVLKRVRTT